MLITKLSSIENWDSIKKSDGSCIIIKLSPICPTSFMAEKVFKNWVSELEINEKISFYSVNVINDRPLSNHLASELSVVHQSPQALFLNPKSQIVETASHYSITADWLNQCLKTANINP